MKKKPLFTLSLLALSCALPVTAKTPAGEMNAALIQAACQTNVEGVETAIKNGADVNACNPQTGRTALSEAILSNRSFLYHTVKLLLEKGADPRIADANGHTPLDHALANRGERYAGIFFLLALHQMPVPPEVLKEELELAANDGQAEWTRLALQAGGDPNSTVREGVWIGEPLLISAGRGYECHYEGDPAATVKVLLAYGANPNARTQKGVPMMMDSRLADRDKILPMLLAAGADPNSTDKDGRTSLMVSQKEQDVQALLAHGAKIDARDHQGRTALMYPHEGGAVRALLHAGADPQATDAAGESALIHLCRATSTQGHSSSEGDGIAALIQAGANPNTCDQQGVPALRVAILHGNSPAALALIQAGADLSTCGDDLMAAAIANASLDVVEALINRGANLTPNERQAMTGKALSRYSIRDIRRMFDMGFTKEDIPTDKLAPLAWKNEQRARALLSLLFSHGVNPNIVSPHPRGGKLLPLTNLRLLAVAGAEMNGLDAHGHTALDTTFIELRSELEKESPNMRQLMHLVEYANQLRSLGVWQRSEIYPKRKFVNTFPPAYCPDTCLHLKLQDDLANSLYPYCSPAQGLKALESGADPNDLQHGVPLLYLAASHSRTDTGDALVPAMLAQGAYPNARTRNGRTPLHATSSNSLRTHALLDAGANPNAADLQGITPLMLTESPAVARLLLEYGADATAKDARGHNALHYALERKASEELLQILRNAGASE